MALLWKPGQDRYLIVSAREGQSERKRFYTIEGKAKLGKRITIEAAFFVDEGDRDFVLALRRQLAELRQVCEMVIKAAIGDNPPEYLDEFIAQGRGRLGVYLTPVELTRLKHALARVGVGVGKEVAE